MFFLVLWFYFSYKSRGILLSIGPFCLCCYRRNAFREKFRKESGPNYSYFRRKTLILSGTRWYRTPELNFCYKSQYHYCMTSISSQWCKINCTTLLYNWKKISLTFISSVFQWHFLFFVYWLLLRLRKCLPFTTTVHSLNYISYEINIPIGIGYGAEMLFSRIYKIIF